MSNEEDLDEEPLDEFDEDALPDGVPEDEFDPADEETEGGDPKSATEDDEDDEDEAGAKPATSSEDDEDEPDPSDVEADLDEILRDRIASGDDEDEEEENEGSAPIVGSENIEGRRESEIHCPHCFLLVTTHTVAETGECPHCGGPIE